MDLSVTSTDFAFQRGPFGGAGPGAGAGQGNGTGGSDAPVVVGVPPAATAPRVITIRGRDGTQTIEIPSRAFDNVIPPQAVDMTVAFFLLVAVIIIGLPIARALARRMDRRSTPAQVPQEVTSQLAQLNQSVDAIALEIERISEGQRFTTKLLSDQRDAARQTLPSHTDR